MNVYLGESFQKWREKIAFSLNNIALPLVPYKKINHPFEKWSNQELTFRAAERWPVAEMLARLKKKKKALSPGPQNPGKKPVERLAHAMPMLGGKDRQIPWACCQITELQFQWETLSKKQKWKTRWN